MKAKHLIILVLLAAVLGGWAYFGAWKKTQNVSPLVGAKVLPDLPVNSVGKIVITAPGSTVVVAKVNDAWIVPSRFNYPAKFDKIADVLLELSDMSVGQVVNLSKEQLGDLSLLPPDQGGRGEAGTLVELMDEDEQLLDHIIIGQAFVRRPAPGAEGQMRGFAGYPDGQYVRRSDDKVFLVSRTLGRITEDANTWLDDEMVDVSASEIEEIAASAPGGEEVRISRSVGGDLVLEGLDTELESSDASKINRMAGALRYLSFDDVVSPAMTSAETGMDAPALFTARTKAGRVYTMKIGAETGDGSRYLRIEVASDAPRGDDDQTEGESSPVPDLELAEQAEKLNAKLGKWTYIVRAFRVEPMLMSRDDIVTMKEPASGDESSGSGENNEGKMGG